MLLVEELLGVGAMTRVVEQTMGLGPSWRHDDNLDKGLDSGSHVQDGSLAKDGEVEGLVL